MNNNSTGYPWLKFYTAWLDNPRFFRLSDLAKAIYFEIYLLAGRSDAGGLILADDEPATITDIASILRRDSQVLQAGLAELQAVKFVNLTDDFVMVIKFENDQGPSMAEKRLQWAKRQQKRRAIARGEIPADDDPDPENPDPEKEKEKDLKKEKETESLKIKELKIKDSDKEVARESRVTINNDDDEVLKGQKILESDILEIWNDGNDQHYKPSQAFMAMIKTFCAEGVTGDDFRQAISIHQEKGTAEIKSPLSLQKWAINAKNDRIAKDTNTNKNNVSESKMQDQFRKLYKKINNGD